MSVAVCLLVYGVAVAVLAPPVLLRLTEEGVSARLGLMAWLAAVAAVLVSWTAAAGFAMAELIGDAGQPGQLVWRSCMGQLQAVATGRYGPLVQASLWALAALVTATVGLAAVRVARSLYRARAASGEHGRMARLAGRSIDGLDVVVLKEPRPAAYCVAGRAPTIVLTTGAVAALTPRQLVAVLGHERAHLTGHHHLLLAATRALATLAPRITLFRVAADQVARLTEMCADDTAARDHTTTTVLDALLALSTSGAALPRGAVGASGVAVLTRARRLAHPATRRRRLRVALLLATTALLISIGPAAITALTAAGLSWCGPTMTN